MKAAILNLKYIDKIKITRLKFTDLEFGFHVVRSSA